jgi:hypothetical protein
MSPATSTDLPTWLAATTISALFWWTIVSPLLIVGVAVLAARRPRLQYWLTIAICLPPLLELAPLAVMRTGAGAGAAAGAAALEAAAVSLAVAALVVRRCARTRDSETAQPAGSSRSVRLGTAALVCGVAAGMLGALAFLMVFS